MGSCRACGWSGDLDNGHKLAKEILRNPPSCSAMGDEQGKLDKKARQQLKAEKQRRNAAESGADDGDQKAGDAVVLGPHLGVKQEKVVEEKKVKEKKKDKEKKAPH